MAGKEKVPVDHSAITGPKPQEPPKSDFLAAATAVLEPEKAKAQAPQPSGAFALVEKGKKLMPPRILLYGLDGLGKSSFAAQAPDPIFIDTEDRLREINAAKFPHSTTYEDVFSKLRAVSKDQHSYGTVVIDSLDWLERLIWDYVCRQDPKGASHIEKVGGGFGKGYKFALDHWREILNLVNECNVKRGMVVILTAHTNIERFEDPENPAYDRYEPRLHYLAGDMIREAVDATLFLTKRLAVKRDEMGFGKERGLGVAVGADGGERILRTVGSPAWVAKNSYNLPSELPFPRTGAWDIFVNAMMKGREIA